MIARIQHHPSRADLLPRLVAALEGMDVQVCAHASTPPNPWAGYKRCLRELPATGHVLVLQDDALPAVGFVPAVEQIAQAHPSTPVCLFLSGLPQGTLSYARRALTRGQRYSPVYAASNVVNTVAVLWPVEKAQEFLAWAERAKLPGHPNPRADDGVLAAWVKRTRQALLVTCPSIVEHDFQQKSVKGGNRDWSKDRGGRAFALAEDAAAFDWLSGSV